MTEIMLKTVLSGTFFGNSRPHGIPTDTDTPNLNLLIDRIYSLDPSSYPLKALQTILQRENKRIGAGQAALDFIGAIDNNTLFVVCGQQAGLFGGPLYTLYKAMHTVRLSSILSEQTGKKVIPLFWIASDDHDFQEVNSLGLRTNDGVKMRVDYTPGNYIHGVPVGEIIIDESIFEAIDKLSEHCIPGDISDRYIDILRSSWMPGSKWSDAFAVHLSKLFSNHGLVMFDPRWEGIKELFKDVMIAELNDPLASSKLINEEADKFETSKKRRKALRKSEGSTNLFLEIDGIRFPLFTDKKGFRAGESVFSRDEMLNLINSEPGKFSPGAALRPVCQDTILPAAALISGPGERNYLKQITPVYKLFKVNRSIPWPRASFTIIDRRTIRVSEKERMDLERLFLDIDNIRLEFARKTFPDNINDEMESFVTTIDKGFDSLAENIGAIDSTLINSIKKEKGKVLHIIGKIRERAVRAHKATLNIKSNRLASVSYFLMPDQSPQERWFGMDAITSVLNGEGFDELLKITSPGEEFHRIVLQEKT